MEVRHEYLDDEVFAMGGASHLLVSQDRYQIERFTREAGGRWIYSSAAGSDRAMQIESIGCVLALREVFAKVDGVYEPEVAPYR